MINNKNIEKIQQEVSELTPEELLKWAYQTFEKKIVLASSLGLEDQILTHMIATHAPDLRIITLDTGRQFPESYEVIEESMKKYDFRYEVQTPEKNDLQEMVNSKGPNLFYNSLEERKLCCKIRKIDPLKKVLTECDAWITGLRAEQSDNRNTLEFAAFDQAFGLLKFNPLAAWSWEQCLDYVKANNIPVNALHANGFPSIGCQPCTRAVAEGEHPRKGRWWWEDEAAQECGLHVVDGKLVRKNA